MLYVKQSTLKIISKEQINGSNVNYYQIATTHGDVEAEEIDRILNTLNFQFIYIKCLQNLQIIQEYIPHVAVINIEDLGCPRLDQLCYEETLPCCIFHMTLNPKQCTFYKVFALKKWFVNNT